MTVDVPSARFPPEIEATAYFVISEALTNVVKHAHANCATVTAGVHRGQLKVEITDDGIGGANRAAATGLVGLEDRVSGLGGRLVLQSREGEGTRMRAFLPLPDGR